MARERADIGDVEDCLEADIALDAQAHAVYGRELPIKGIAYHAGRADQSGLARRDVLEPVIQQLRLKYGRRICDLVEGDVALHAVIRDSEAAADDGLAITEHIVSEAQARPPLRATIIVAAARETFAGLADPVGQIATPQHNRANAICR